MQIFLKGIGRRFNAQWIFKNVATDFQEGHCYAILGPNGSGKSTLLQVISGHLTPSEGAVSFVDGGHTFDKERVYRLLSFSAPYMELLEELTLREHLAFHGKMKGFIEGQSHDDIAALAGLFEAMDKPIRLYSSGMKQRVKLCLAFYSSSPLLLLDEPTANLDDAGIAWYRSLAMNLPLNRILIVASNQESEYDFCNERIYIADYKE